jgi:hypothetical protein
MRDYTHIRVEREIVNALDDYMHEHRLRSRGVAIRHLLASVTSVNNVTKKELYGAPADVTDLKERIRNPPK